MTKRTALITGAGQGMGRAIALKFAENGIHCRLVGKTASKLESVAAEIADSGGSAEAHVLDVTDDAAVAQLGDQLGESTLDILVNCAGDWLIQTLQDTSNQQLDHILSTNLRAPYLMSRTLLPNLRRSGNASIINIGSLVTANLVPMVSAYTASKLGLKGMTGSLAAELKPDLIRVVMISPGPTDTPMRDAASPGIDKSILVEPRTIAELAYTVVTLPRGITTSDFTLHSLLFPPLD